MVYYPNEELQRNKCNKIIYDLNTCLYPLGSFYIENGNTLHVFITKNIQSYNGTIKDLDQCLLDILFSKFNIDQIEKVKIPSITYKHYLDDVLSPHKRFAIRHQFLTLLDKQIPLAIEN